MPSSHRTLAAVARTQGGYFTAAQAVAAGYSHQAQRHHVQSGNWVRVERGIFRFVEWPEPPRADLIRLTLWSRGRAVVSHDTALSFHELGDVNPARVHLTVPHGFRARAPGAVLHFAELPGEDVQQHEGFRLTTPSRSILDCAGAGIEIDQLARAIEDALARGLTTTDTLRARADAFGPAAALAVERAFGQLQ